MSSQRSKIIRRSKFYFGSTTPVNIITPNDWCTRGPLEAAGFSFFWDVDDLDPSCLMDDGRPPKKFKFKSKKVTPLETPIYIYEFIGYVEIKLLNNNQLIEWIGRPIFNYNLKEIMILKSWKDIRPGNKKLIGFC